MTVHIKRPHNARYIAHARKYGCRKWVKVGEDRKSEGAAAKDMLKAFLGGDYKRAIVAMHEHYYDPVKIMELCK